MATDEDEVIDFGRSDIQPRPQESRLDPIIIHVLARSSLAVILTILLVLTIVWAFVNVGTSAWANTKELLDIALPTEAALLTAAVAFYFALEK